MFSIVSLKKGPRGLTLIEAIMAVAMIAILAIGALSYQYYGASHSRISQADLTATRIGQLLLEDWKSIGGISGYDPSTLGLGFTKESETSFLLDIDGTTLNAQLATAQIDNQPYAGILRQITVTLYWGNNSSLVLTTYVRQGVD